MKLKVYYGGHSISDKGILKLKLKTDFTQQTEAGALYATAIADFYTAYIDGELYGRYVIDSIKIDSKRDTMLVLKSCYDNKTFIALYEILQNTTEEEMQEITFECDSAGCM